MTNELATKKGKKFALKALAERRKHPPKQIDNGDLIADSPMYFYCNSCGALSDILPECYLTPPAHICKECSALKSLGWLE